MTPLFFRGAFLISEKVLSYNEFMDMPYRDFKRIESTHQFMASIKNGTIQKVDKQKTKEKLSQLNTVKASDLDLPKEYLDIFKEG